jgi:hypothetical protein
MNLHQKRREKDEEVNTDSTTSSSVFPWRHLLRLETAAKIIYIVSPAVYTLLEDEEVCDIVMKDLVIVNLDDVVDIVANKVLK